MVEEGSKGGAAQGDRPDAGCAESAAELIPEGADALKLFVVLARRDVAEALGHACLRTNALKGIGNTAHQHQPALTKRGVASKALDFVGNQLARNRIGAAGLMLIRRQTGLMVMARLVKELKGAARRERMEDAVERKR